MAEILSTVTPTPVRRVLGTAIIAALGGVLVWLALTTATGLWWRVMLLAFGVAALYATLRLWQATAARVELTETQLRLSTGLVLADLDQIVAIDRGMFAFKPSNGFVVKLARVHDRGWAPGLWWRTGRRIGIGGVTSAHEAKMMAELIAMLIAARQANRS